MSGGVSLRSNPTIQIRQSAKALIRSSDQVLLIKEKHADGSEFWTLPGGGVKTSESLTDALHRELAEEINCQASINNRLTQLWYAHVSSPNKISKYTVFECDLVSLADCDLSEGILEKKWVNSDNLPPKTLLQIKYLLEKYHF